MNGLLLKLLDDSTGNPGKWFGKLFAPIRQDLDRLYWCFCGQPWMGSPPGFDGGDVFERIEEQHDSDIQLWRPGNLTKYAQSFGEEYIELWGIEPTRDDPRALAGRYSDENWNEEAIQQHARVWLLYTDSTCWEIFARKDLLLKRVHDELYGKPWVEVHTSDSRQRGWAFGMTGLSRIWRNLHRRRG